VQERADHIAEWVQLAEEKLGQLDPVYLASERPGQKGCQMLFWGLALMWIGRKPRPQPVKRPLTGARLLAGMIYWGIAIGFIGWMAISHRGGTWPTH
jgi:hypothetical protein